MRTVTKSFRDFYIGHAVGEGRQQCGDGPREALESNCREALNASCIKRIPAQYFWDCYLQSAR
jgi:hypothetical protein